MDNLGQAFAGLSERTNKWVMETADFLGNYLVSLFDSGMNRLQEKAGELKSSVDLGGIKNKLNPASWGENSLPSPETAPGKVGRSADVVQSIGREQERPGPGISAPQQEQFAGLLAGANVNPSFGFACTDASIDSAFAMGGCGTGRTQTAGVGF